MVKEYQGKLWGEHFAILDSLICLVYKPDFQSSACDQSSKCCSWLRYWCLQKWIWPSACLCHFWDVSFPQLSLHFAYSFMCARGFRSCRQVVVLPWFVAAPAGTQGSLCSSSSSTTVQWHTAGDGKLSVSSHPGMCFKVMSRSTLVLCMCLSISTFPEVSEEFMMSS